MAHARASGVLAPSESFIMARTRIRRIGPRLHAGRAVGRDRHHRRAGRPAAAGDSGRSRSGPPQLVHEQPQANRPGRAEPPRRRWATIPAGRDRFDQAGVSWAFRLLPYLEATNVFKSFVAGQRVDDDANVAAMRTPIDVYACPSRRSAAADRDFDNNDEPPMVRGRRGAGRLRRVRGRRLHERHDDGDRRLRRRRPASRHAARPRRERRHLQLLEDQGELRDRRAVEHARRSATSTSRRTPTTTRIPTCSHYEQGDTAFLAGDTPHTIFAGTGHGHRARARATARERSSAASTPT